ncbi:MAG: long-chain fatty acid--CoA ligase [Chloroflexi bacterium]|nr:long-chain fatty acid--CoA ligase [Chloroflexota bacterium]
MGISETKPWLKHYEAGVPHHIEYPRAPVHWFLEDAAARYPNATAVIFPGRLGDATRLTYRQVNDLANRFGNALLALGVKKGDRVALLLPNCPQFVIAYYGILKVGGIVVACNPLYSPRELEHQLRDCGAETIISLSLFYPRVLEVRPRTSLRHVVPTNIKEYLPPLTRLLFTLLRERKEGHRPDTRGDPMVVPFPSLLRQHPPTRPTVEVGADDICLFQYTGGTTGTPKAAVATHFNLVANTLQIRHWITDTQEGKEVALGVMPLFHAYGLVAVLGYTVAAASAIVLLPRFETDVVLQTIARLRPTLFPGVPTMYIAVNNHPRTPRYNLRSIRVCMSGGAPLPVEVQRRFEELTGGKLVEGYGLSEAPVATHVTPVRGLRKVGSIGVPLPDVEAKIVDLDSGEKEMPVGEPGEMVIRAPQVMGGYWSKPEETALAIRNGWLYTGDIAKMDEDGYFTIVDRKKDMLIAGGFNIYPREIEEALYEHPKVKEAVAVGVPDEYRGETLKVFIVLKEGESATPDEIIAFCRQRLARYKIPQYVEFRKELPKTMIGKVLRRALAEEEKAKRAGQSGS